MVSIQEYGQQLQQRAADLALAQQQISESNPQVLQTTSQLRSATPSTQVSVRQIEQSRREAKESALKDVEVAQAEQRQLEVQYRTAQVADLQYQEALKKQQDFAFGYKLAMKNAPPFELNKVQRAGYQAARQDQESYKERRDALIQLNQLKKQAELLPPKTATVREDFPMIQPGQTLPRQDVTTTKIPSALTVLDKPIITVPGRTEYFSSGDSRQYSRGTIITDRPPVVTPPTVITGQNILNAPSEILRSVGGIAGTQIAKTVGGDFKVTLPGAPEVRISVPQTRTLTSEELGIINKPVPSVPSLGEGTFFLPSDVRNSAANIYGMQVQQVARNPITITPQTVGTVAGAAANVGGYFVPVLGTALAASDIVVGAKQAFVDKAPYEKINADDALSKVKSDAAAAGQTISKVQEAAFREDIANYNKEVESANKMFKLQGGLRLAGGLTFFGAKAYQAEKAQEAREATAQQEPQVQIVKGSQRNKLIGEIKQDLSGKSSLDFTKQKLTSTRAYIAKVNTPQGTRYFEAVEFGKAEGVPSSDLFGTRTLFVREVDESGRLISRSVGVSLEKATSDSTDIFTKLIRQEEGRTFFDKITGTRPAPESVGFFEKVKLTGKEARDIGGKTIKVYRTTSDVRSAFPLGKIGEPSDETMIDIRKNLKVPGAREMAEFKTDPFSQAEFEAAPKVARGSNIEYVGTKGGTKYFNVNKGANAEREVISEAARAGPSRLSRVQVIDLYPDLGTEVTYPAKIMVDFRYTTTGAGISSGIPKIVAPLNKAPSFISKVTTALGEAASGAKTKVVDIFTRPPLIEIPTAGGGMLQAVSKAPLAVSLVQTTPSQASRAVGAFAKAVAVTVEPSSKVFPLATVGGGASLLVKEPPTQASKVLFKVDLSQAQTNKQATGPITKETPILGSGSVNRLSSGTLQEPAFAQTPAEALIVSPITSPLTVTPQEPQQALAPSSPPFVPSTGLGYGRRRKGNAFMLPRVMPRKRNIKVITQIKRRGKYFPISGAVTPEEGVRLGVGATRRTLARSFRLVAIGVKPEEVVLTLRPNPNIYRAPYGKKATKLTFVEKNPFALRGSRTAVSEIIQARRAKAVKFL